MRWRLLLILILTSFRLYAQDMNRVRQNLAAFTAPELHGRGYVNEGDKKAAEFIKTQFQKAGLQPFSGSYFQDFTLPVNTISEVKLQLNSQELKPGIDFIPDAAAPEVKGKLKTVWLDTLIFSNEQRGKIFLNQNLKNKVLLVPEKFGSKISVLPDAFRRKMQETGAVITVHPQKLTYTVARQQNKQPQFDVLQKSVPGNVKKSKFEIEAKFIPEYQTQNVIGYIPGRTQPDSFLVFTAHYDHLGRIDENTYFPGANDNASGTSMLLELAHHYGNPENQPDFSMVFIAFGAEEAGLIGSKYYVENPLFPLSKISFLINLDLNGTGDDGIMVVNGKIHEKEFAAIQKLNNQKQYFSQVKSREKANNSDHAPFSNKGVKAFFIYTLGGTTFYHDVHDKAETLPLTKFTELFQLIRDFSKALTVNQ